MTERLGFLYLLLTLWVRNTKESGGVNEDNEASSENNNLAVFIVPPLILLLLLIVAVVTIRLLILPWCKARKLKSANICTAYDDTGENQLDNEHYVDYGITEDNEYCNLKMQIKTDYRYVDNSEDSTVTYAEVICK